MVDQPDRQMGVGAAYASDSLFPSMPSNKQDRSICGQLLASELPLNSSSDLLYRRTFLECICFRSSSLEITDLPALDAERQAVQIGAETLDFVDFVKQSPPRGKLVNFKCPFNEALMLRKKLLCEQIDQRLSMRNT